MKLTDKNCLHSKDKRTETNCIELETPDFHFRITQMSGGIVFQSVDRSLKVMPQSDNTIRLGEY